MYFVLDIVYQRKQPDVQIIIIASCRRLEHVYWRQREHRERPLRTRAMQLHRCHWTIALFGEHSSKRTDTRRTLTAREYEGFR